MRAVVRILRDVRGVSSLEYSILIGLVVIVVGAFGSRFVSNMDALLAHSFGTYNEQTCSAFTAEMKKR